MPRDDRDDYLDQPGSGGGRSSIRRSIDEATDRMFELIEEAARAAASIRADASDRAKREDAAERDEPRKRASTEDGERVAIDRVNAISKLADSLVEYADQVRFESERLLSTLGEKVREASREEGRPREPTETGRYTPRDQDSDERERDTRNERLSRRFTSKRDRGSRDDRVPEKAVLRAAQMAVAGASREEIEEALVEEFRVRDPGSIVDSILD